MTLLESGMWFFIVLAVAVVIWAAYIIRMVIKDLRERAR